MIYRPPLHVHIIHHPDFTDGEVWCDRSLKWLSGDPDAFAVPSADIPVYVWSGDHDVPPAFEWGEATRTVAIFLVDDEWLASPEWRAWANEQEQNRGPQDRIIVVALTKNVGNLGEPVTRAQMIRLERIAGPKRLDEFILQLTFSLARLMLQPGHARSRIFLSHTKFGGRDFALALKGFLDGRPGGDHFFDEVDLDAGEDFEAGLTDAVTSSVVVLILTDRFCSRYWCGWEVITAKTHRRPMMVIDALEIGEPTSLAYAGNLRTIRWDRSRLSDESMHQTVVAGALLELLRAEHNRARVDAARAAVGLPDDADVLGTPPELASLRAPDGKTITILHPDPPLPVYEVELIKRHRPDSRIASLTQLLADSRARSLERRRIAISISDGPDREKRGFRSLHQHRLWTRITSLLLASGAELAYGGDLRSSGYTDQLWDLVRGTLDAGGQLPNDVVHNYLAWPIHLQLTSAQRASLPSVIRPHLLVMPSALSRDPKAFIAPSSMAPDERFALAVGINEMRVKMATECAARILIGGQYRSVGPIPGLAEEFLTTVGRSPLYLVGALGGMARVLIRAMMGDRPSELTRGFQEDGGARASIIDHYNSEVRSGGWPTLIEADYDGLTDRLNALGVSSLDNGLDVAENQRLFYSRDMVEITSLILTGLVRRIKP